MKSFSNRPNKRIWNQYSEFPELTIDQFLSHDPNPHSTSQKEFSDTEHPIPDRIIFIWLGKSFPYSNHLAISSVYKQCKPKQILFICDEPKFSNKDIELLEKIPVLRFSPAEDFWFDDLPPGGEIARQLFHSLTMPSSRSNLLRMAVLWKIGGIYLDTDTITTQNMSELRKNHGFCGLEPIALPGKLYSSKNPFRWGLAGLRMGVRHLLSKTPGGFKLFRNMENLYPAAANNAVFASKPFHPLITRAFKIISQMDPKLQRQQFRLGTHLLQSLTGNHSSPEMKVFPSSYFYPLGPEISNQWFFSKSHSYLDQMLLPQTHVVHWYHSVEKRVLKQALNQEWLKSHPNSAIAHLIQKFC